MYKFKASEMVKEGRTNWDLIKEIQKWLESTSLPPISEECIVLFLEACDNDMEITQYTITSNFQCKKIAPEIFNNRNVSNPELVSCFSAMAMAAIPNKTEKGHAVSFFRILDNSYSKFDFLAQCKISTMLIDLHQHENPPIAYEGVVDIRQFSMKFLPKIQIRVMRKLFNFIQEGLPVKFKTFHVLNCSPVFDTLMSVFKTCMKKELASTFKLYPPNMDKEEFFKNGIPANCMPSDYGGTLDTLEELSQQTFSKLKELQHFFDEEEDFRKKYNY